MGAKPAKTAKRAAQTGSVSSRAQFKSDIDELRGRLAAVVNATSEAANTIISGLEDVIAQGEGGDAQNRAFDALSACVFHDIVGQHVARAAELLEIIERLGGSHDDATLSEAHAAALKRATRMLSGPAVEGDDSIDQASVDDFFK